jgi:hypothetical protein
MEGGIAVAPASFGRYGGDLIAPSETSGRVYAIRPDGTVATVAVSGLPHGGDIGVESAGFVPPRFGPGGAAFLADRYSRGNRHPGTNSMLRLPGPALLKAGARAGDLLVATEAGARTILVHCARSCTVRYVAAGPAVTHAEGHIVFAPGPFAGPRVRRPASAARPSRQPGGAGAVEEAADLAYAAVACQHGQGRSASVPDLYARVRRLVVR